MKVFLEATRNALLNILINKKSTVTKKEGIIIIETTMKTYKSGTFFMGVPGVGKMRISLMRFCFPTASLPLISKVIIGIGREKLPST